MLKPDSQKKGQGAEAMLGYCPHIQIVINFQAFWRVPQIPGNSHLHCAALAAASVPINISVELIVFQSVETHYLNSIKARHNAAAPWNL